MENQEIQGSPLLGEHEGARPADAEEKSGTYQPTPEEQAAIRLVEKVFEKNKKHRKKYDGKWMDHYKMFRGKQWKEERPSYRNSAVINIIWRVIQSQAPIETDSRPKFEFLPQEPTDYELSIILNELCEADWTKKNWLMKIVEAVYDKRIYGTGFGGMEFNQDYNDGLGDICFETYDPFYQFPDPNCYDINDKKCKNYLEAEPIDIDVLKSEYADKAAWLKPDLQEFYGSDKTNVTSEMLKTPVDNLAYTENYNDGYGVEARKILKKTLWIYEDTTTEEPREVVGDDGTVTKEYIKKKKYPKGRKIVTANKVLLEDAPIEYEDGKIPKAKLVHYMLPREFWGVGDVENLSDLNVNYNKIFSFILDVLELMGNPIWVISQDTGIDTDNVYNRHGMILEPASSEGTVQRVEGVQLQPYVLQIFDRVKAEIDELAGDRDVSRGVNPTGVTAASAIEALQETAQTRQRQHGRFMDAFLQSLGQQWLSRTMQYRTVPQIYRLTNNMNATKYFKFHVEDQPVMQQAPPMIDPMTGMEMPQPPQPVMGVDGMPEMQKVVNYSEIGMDGAPIAGTEKSLVVNGNFDVKVSTGSALAFDKARKSDQAYQLFDRGLVDPQYVYETLELPNWQAVMTRMQQKAMADAQMQMQQAAMAQPPTPGAPPPPGQTM